MAVTSIDTALPKVYTVRIKEEMTFKSDHTLNLVNFYAYFVFRDLEHLQTELVDRLNDNEENLKYKISWKKSHKYVKIRCVEKCCGFSVWFDAKFDDA